MENVDYRNNLEQILAFTNGRNLLTTADVLRFTGIRDYRTAHRRFPFQGNTISAATLARCLCGGSK